MEDTGSYHNAIGLGSETINGGISADVRGEISPAVLYHQLNTLIGSYFYFICNRGRIQFQGKTHLIVLTNSSITDAYVNFEAASVYDAKGSEVRSAIFKKSLGIIDDLILYCYEVGVNGSIRFKVVDGTANLSKNPYA